ncbi:DUF3793 family protein [Acidaminobacter sp. JC074]|uniref:DUF3793 family protein n=1 Tax=Acidaminobacter sp. JC074 TaxID=2530199 RepID=UPI001F107888|nr:DUF3793 family protein [Acidaminobacter sp. JC074]MCH4886542.1 DUF3793 family protein [Acidaminobacter sp. JC074]
MNQENLFYKLIYYTAPTLTKEKTASLVNLKDDVEPLHTLWHEYKDKIHLDYIELKVERNRTLVLFYNKDMLSSVLACKKNRNFLSRFGYKSFETGYALELLKKRFKEVCPHEVGIFLGYPLHDVKCFADCSPKKCLAVGYWKVFSNLEVALETFDRYDERRTYLLSFVDSGYLPSEVMRMTFDLKEAI